MRKTLIPLFALAVITTGAIAQTAPAPTPAPPSTTMPATPPTGAEGERPQAGANSFTEAQARMRMEQAGFTSVTDLRKDDQGIWWGRGMRGTRTVEVALDFRGNVFPK